MRNPIPTLTCRIIYLASLSCIVLLTGCTARSINSNTQKSFDSFRPATATPAPQPQAKAVKPQSVSSTGPKGLQSSAGPSKAAASLPTPRPVEPVALPTQIPAATPTPQLAFSYPLRVIIPAIGLDAPIVPMGWSMVQDDGQQVSEWDVPDYRAVGWLKTSALIGEVGNTVLEGHQDIAGRVFEYLDTVQAGDEIQVQTDSDVRKYLVVLKTILPDKGQPLAVRQQNAKWIAPSADERLTLVTCWPRNDNTHRLIVVAVPKK